MEDYNIYKAIRKGSEHMVYCEDATLHVETEGLIFIASLDGCSGGYRSHFASELMAKLVRKVIPNVLSLTNMEAGSYDDLALITERIMRGVLLELVSIRVTLDIQDLELLSTIVFAVINPITDEAYCVISGDGLIYVNGHSYERDDIVNNAPDYMAVYTNPDHPGMLGSLMKFRIDNVKDLSVCSDGIDTFLDGKGNRSDKQYIRENLLEGDFLHKSEAMLSRRINILSKKDKLIHYDDISIVRYIKNIPDDISTIPEQS
jgi:hypothetical protein